MRRNDKSRPRYPVAFADWKVPLAGFSVIEADEVVKLVGGTPCAPAKGAIEIRPIIAINDAGQK